MPEPDDLAALEAELQLVATGAWTLTPEWADRIIAALRRAKEWKRLLEESDNYGAFCRMKQTIAELRAGLEWMLGADDCPYDAATTRAHVRDLLARTAPATGQQVTAIHTATEGDHDRPPGAQRP